MYVCMYVCTYIYIYIYIYIYCANKRPLRNHALRLFKPPPPKISMLKATASGVARRSK